jgi:AbiJ-like protein
METQQRPSGQQLVALKNQVVQGFGESHWLELGAITEMLDAVSSHPRLLRSLGWNDDDYEGIVLQMLKDMIDARPQNYVLILDYISRTCPEGGDFISSSDDGARRIVFSPSAFVVPAERPDLNLVSVMMPFTEELSSVYDTVRAAASATGFHCSRADDIWDNSTVIQDVFSLIFRSYIVVCDFSGRNPNVFYEAGIAHTLGKHVIPITQSADDIPFDLKHHRYALYLNNSEGRDKLRGEMVSRLQGLAAKKIHAPWA